jgi:hypothetical protein
MRCDGGCFNYISKYIDHFSKNNETFIIQLLNLMCNNSDDQTSDVIYDRIFAERCGYRGLIGSGCAIRPTS